MLGVRHAELTVPEQTSDFGVTVTSAPRSPTWTHDIGRRAAPRWRITTDCGDDHVWRVETLPGGRLLEPRGPAPEDLEWSYLTWADGSRGEDGFDALLALPPGRYRLVRSAVAPGRTDRILLGNDRVPRPPAFECLLDEQSLYAVAWSADAGPPRYDRPLVGVVTPDGTGHGDIRSALFLDCVGSAGSGRTGGDLVLVIPMTAPLDFHPTCVRDGRRWSVRDATGMAAALTARHGW